MIHGGRVQVGDVWRDNDPREGHVGREVEVKSIEACVYANCVAKPSGRRVRILVRRMVAGSRYTLRCRIGADPEAT